MMNIIAGAIIVSFSLINYFYLSTIVSFSSILYIAIIVITGIPIFLIKFMEQRKIKNLEEAFPLFLRDFVQSARSGMTIPQAFKSISNNDYHTLTPYIKKITAQLDWGIPLEKVLVKFSKATKSKLIGRIISSVIEAHRFGGNLADTFEALSRTALEVERLRSERRLYMNSQMITGYIIFFVFLGVMIALGTFLIPNIAGTSMSMSLTGTGKESISCPSLDQEVCETQIGNNDEQACYWDKKKMECQAMEIRMYKELFMTLILIQGFFAGLIVGKMSEGSMISGIRHSFIMMFVGILVFILLG